MKLLLLLCALPMVSLAGLAGGLKDITLQSDDPNVLFALTAINGFYAKQGDNAARQLVTIESAQSQVVQGTLYHLTLRVDSGAQEELCKINVWSRPWLSGDDAMQVTKDPACKPVTDAVDAKVTKMPLVGGENPIDPQSTEVMDALNFAVLSLNAQENYLFQRRATKIAKVTSQVVSGISYHFYGVEMSATECTKSSNQLLSTCNVANGADVRMCNFDVWWQSWMTPEYKLINVSCK